MLAPIKHQDASAIDSHDFTINVDLNGSSIDRDSFSADPTLPSLSLDGEQVAPWSVSPMAHLSQLSAAARVEELLPNSSSPDCQTVSEAGTLEVSSVITSTNRAPALKTRIRCSRPGCKLTFRRKYELQRHEKSVHDRSTALFCSVYGCNRIANKPLPRIDHFQSHMKKHQTAHLFVCIFNHCRLSPFTQQELLDHLNSQHSHDECCTATEKACLAYFEWRQTPLSDGTLLFESERNCPLTFLGCNYVSNDTAFKAWHIEESKHLESHELIDRARGYEAIAYLRYSWTWISGLAICPICRLQSEISFSAGKFCSHLEQHSKEERISKATDLAEMFRPCLAGKVEWSSCCRDSFGAMITAELEEAGLLTKAEEWRSACSVLWF